MGKNEKAWGIGFRRLIGDESLGETFGIVVDDTNKQVHIVGINDVETDWALSADSYPALYLHGSASASEYIKMYTDSTDAHLNVVGANLDVDVPSNSQVAIQVNDTDEYVFDSATANFKGNTLGSLGTSTFLGQINAGSQIISGAGNIVFVTGRSLIGTGLKVDGGGTAIALGAACYVATGTGTITDAVLGPAEVGSVTCKGWLKLKDAAGTAICYVPYYNA